jgi:hypothetical protein
MGDYDTLQPHVEIPGVDWLAFTDRSYTGGERDWNVIPVDPLYENPRLAAKVPKILWPPALDAYEETIWIDSNQEVISAGFVGGVMADLGLDGIALWRHSYRDCIYEEVKESMEAGCRFKYEDQKLLEQVARYRNLGYPEHGGLWACAVIARRRSERLDEAMRDWMEENVCWSVQDQISFPVVMWQHGIQPFALPGYPSGSVQASNPWLVRHQHKDGT